MSSQLKPGRRGLCAWCQCDAQQDQGDPDREGEQGPGHDRVHVRVRAVVGRAWAAGVGCHWCAAGLPHPPRGPCASNHGPDPDMDPIVSRSLFGLAVGVALILLGIAIAPPA